MYGWILYKVETYFRIRKPYSNGAIAQTNTSRTKSLYVSLVTDSTWMAIAICNICGSDIWVSKAVTFMSLKLVLKENSNIYFFSSSLFLCDPKNDGIFIIKYVFEAVVRLWIATDVFHMRKSIKFDYISYALDIVSQLNWCDGTVRYIDGI